MNDRPWLKWEFRGGRFRLTTYAPDHKTALHHFGAMVRETGVVDELGWYCAVHIVKPGESYRERLKRTWHLLVSHFLVAYAKFPPEEVALYVSQVYRNRGMEGDYESCLEEIRRSESRRKTKGR